MLGPHLKKDKHEKFHVNCFYFYAVCQGYIFLRITPGSGGAGSVND